MRRFLLSICLIATGSAMWWALSNVALFSVKRWDGKFQSVLQSSLSGLGMTNQDIVSTVHLSEKDAQGQWAFTRITLRMIDSSKRAELKRSLESSGASVEETKRDNNPVLVVRRGRRIYQEITFVPPPIPLPR